jgi:hypothetical protein
MSDADSNMFDVDFGILSSSRSIEPQKVMARDGTTSGNGSTRTARLYAPSVLMAPSSSRLSSP